MRLLEQTFTADPRALKTVRDDLRAALAGVGASDRCSDAVVLAVSEAVSNIIRHGYGGDSTGSVTLELDLADDELRCRLLDEAPPLDFSCIVPRPYEELRPGGLGTHFINETMDCCTYGHRDSGLGNYVLLTRRLERTLDDR